MTRAQVDREILVDILAYGPDKASNVADRISRSPTYVSERLRSLYDDELLRHKGEGVYELTDDGRSIARGAIDVE